MQTIAPALTDTIAGAILNGLKKGIIMNTEELKRLAEAANKARLIAACPDLLEVAEEVINNQDALPAYLVAMAVHAVGRAKG